MSEFKAPDDVWIDSGVFVEMNDIDTLVFDHDPDSMDDDYTTIRYTLTTTAEANTRKAAREVLETVKHKLEYEGYDNTKGLIKNLLAQYQEPQPTEVSNGKS